MDKKIHKFILNLNFIDFLKISFVNLDIDLNYKLKSCQKIKEI